MFELYIRGVASRGLALVLAGASLVLVGCGSVNGAGSRLVNAVTPYRMDIVQGNFVSKEQAAAVRPGMSRAQARDILGTPLLTSAFHADRWDYVFTFNRQGQAPQARTVTVFFKDDVLERIDAVDLPSEAEFVASLDSGKTVAKPAALEMDESTLKKLPTVPKATPSATAAIPASYPPLEGQ